MKKRSSEVSPLIFRYVVYALNYIALLGKENKIIEKIT